jgi:uncharacterized repeat protein (TIGR01451 family)
MWRNVTLRNNLFLGTRYAFEFTTIADEGFRDFDYNAWGTTRAIDPGGPFFKWDDERYDTLPDLPLGVEENGVPAAFSDLVSAELPPAWDIAALPGSQDLRLTTGTAEIDAGAPIPNLNEIFVTDDQPDLGAFEFGEPLPSYGPRAQIPDFSSSLKQASDIIPATGQAITYTITILNQGSPLTETLTITDTIPTGLVYVPGTFLAAAGSPDDSAAPILTWIGAIDDNSSIELTYAVTVTAVAPQPITNVAIGTNVQTESFALTETVFPNGRQVFLPVIRK